MEHDALPGIQRCPDIDQLDIHTMSLNDDLDITSSYSPRPQDNNNNMETMDSSPAAVVAAAADERRPGVNADSILGHIPATDIDCIDSRLHLVSIDEGFFSKSMNSCTSSSQEIHSACRTVPPTTSIDVMEVFSQDIDGDTDLHIAIIQKQNPLALMFISAAPNCEYLDIVNCLLQTPLHLAVITRQENIVRRLIIGGARVDSRDIHGNTPLHIACREGLEDIVQCLLRPVFYEETLTNSYEIPYQRIRQNLNLRNYEGHTCLHLAAMSTHIKVLDALLNKGADVNIGDGRSGRTVLHYASETGNRILLQYLLSQRRLNINCTTFGGVTPLRLALGRGYGDVVNILISNGADVGHNDTSDDESIDDYT